MRRTLGIITCVLVALVGLSCALTEVYTSTPAEKPTVTGFPPPEGTTATVPPPETDAPCIIQATRTPPPGAPTRIPGGLDLPTAYVDPHVEICANGTTFQVGETIAILGQAVDIGMPGHTLSIRDAGCQDCSLSVHMSYIGELTVRSDNSDVLTFVSAEATRRQVVFTLRAQGSGSVTASIRADGEVHYGYPGPATWSGGGSDVILINVTE